MPEIIRTAASTSGDLFWGDCDIGGYNFSHTIEQTLTGSGSSNSPDVNVSHDDTNISSDNDNMESYGIALPQKHLAKRMSNLSVDWFDEF